MDRLIAPYSVPLAQADTAPATGTPQYATDGNPATNTPATLWPAYAWNALQDEIYNVITGAGISADRNSWNQMVLAIKRLVQTQVVLADTGAANAYAAANNPPLVAGTWVNGVVQQIVVAHTNTGASTYSPDGLPTIPIYGLGLQPLQQGEMLAGGTAILMKQTIAGVNGGNPICVLLECAGGAQQIAAATQSNHAAQLGQVNPGRLLNVQVFSGNGTYTPTSGMTKCIVDIVGGGGGTGGSPATGSGQFSGSAGSSSGSYARVQFTAAQIGASQAVTVGAGGTAGGSGTSTGGTGGTSSLGSLVSCPGGPGSSSYGPTGSTFNVAASPALAANPTVSTGTTIAVSRGTQGGPAIGGVGGGVIAGAAGISPMVPGGVGTGATGTAAASNISAQSGFSGTAGALVIYEYA